MLDRPTDDPETVKLLSKDKTALMVCPLCSLDLPTGTIMINDETKTVAGLKIEAVPAYEVKGKFGVFRPTKGASNGYVITFGDKRVYVGGETENVPEVKALKQIDAAFLPVIRTMPPSDVRRYRQGDAAEDRFPVRLRHQRPEGARSPSEGQPGNRRPRP